MPQNSDESERFLMDFDLDSLDLDANWDVFLPDYGAHKKARDDVFDGLKPEIGPKRMGKSAFVKAETVRLERLDDYISVEEDVCRTSGDLDWGVLGWSVEAHFLPT